MRKALFGFLLVWITGSGVAWGQSETASPPPRLPTPVTVGQTAPAHSPISMEPILHAASTTGSQSRLPPRDALLTARRSSWQFQQLLVSSRVSVLVDQEQPTPPPHHDGDARSRDPPAGRTLTVRHRRAVRWLQAGS